jgi:hypothetical protein
MASHAGRGSSLRPFLPPLFESAAGEAQRLRVDVRPSVVGTDGTYEFDATVRHEVAGMEFLTIVEAKQHKNPIKRELVQVLRDKVQSVGAQKGVMVATAPYQKGAVDYALVHGIALVTVTEGRFTLITRAATPTPTPSRESARRLGIPDFVGHCYSRGDTIESISVTAISPAYPEYVARLLLAWPEAD